jgi:hypothetical protein
LPRLITARSAERKQAGRPPAGAGDPFADNSKKIDPVRTLASFETNPVDVQRATDAVLTAAALRAAAGA